METGRNIRRNAELILKRKQQVSDKYRKRKNNLQFNPVGSTIMHVDLNSCFASVEQQANPKLRGKPIAVAAYTTPSGCILAPSVEAKECGIKTGMRVKDGKTLCPGLIVLSPDPEKYRSVHAGLRKIFSVYSNDFYPKSIDEFVMDLEGYPSGPVSKEERNSASQKMFGVAREIKKRIKAEVGDWLTVSVGIAANRFLAKTASNLHKPDGLDEINKDNFREVYEALSLTDLCGIAEKNAARLNSFGIHTVTDFYQAPAWKLKAAFNSINGYYWYLRLRGWEIDDVIFGRKSYGNSYALPKPLSEPHELAPILTKLVEKMSFRLRRSEKKAFGVHLGISYRDGGYWHKGGSFSKALFSSVDIYKKAYGLMLKAPHKKPVRELAVSCFNLVKVEKIQLELFSDVIKKQSLSKAQDAVNERWGEFVLTSARMLSAKDAVPDRIAFGQAGLGDLSRYE